MRFNCEKTHGGAGGKAADDLIAIKSGLQVTDKLIASGKDGLSEGASVHVTSDDPIIGMNRWHS